MPDEELLGLAEKKKLHEPDTLRAQVERMLKDGKAAAFPTNFAGQWLSLRNIDATAPDPALYPEYDDVLKVAMVKETQLFFEEVLKEDLSMTNFVFGIRHAQRAIGPTLRHRRRHRGGIPKGACRRSTTAEGFSPSRAF